MTFYVVKFDTCAYISFLASIKITRALMLFLHKNHYIQNTTFYIFLLLFQARNNDICASSSPALKKTPDVNKSIILSRGSVKKSSKKRKVSFVTPIRRSARLSCLTPQYSSVKDRPKTPIPSRDSSGRKGRFSSTKMFSGSLFISNSSRKSSEGNFIIYF